MELKSESSSIVNWSPTDVRRLSIALSASELDDVVYVMRCGQLDREYADYKRHI